MSNLPDNTSEEILDNALNGMHLSEMRLERLQKAIQAINSLITQREKSREKSCSY